MRDYATSARPEVRGTADVGWRSLFPLPINPPRTHDYIICVFGPTGGGGHEYAALRTILVCGDGGGVCRGPRPATSFGPQHELPPARLVIHRTDLCP